MKPGPKAGPVAERFWDQVRSLGAGPDDCWEWAGARFANGRGNFYISPERRSQLAYRVSWELTNGPIAVGLQICHHCDNPGCVRPSHLFLGTQQDNARDALAKARRRKTRRYLSPGAKEAIRRSYVQTLGMGRYAPERMTMKQLAVQFGVGRSTIGRVVHGVSFARPQAFHQTSEE